MKTVDIIGAGIGGLTTAIALKKKGFVVRVFDQAPEIKPVGAGILLAFNAMQVYNKLGIRKEIEALGNKVSAMKITNSQLHDISSVDLDYFNKKYQVNTVAIHRAFLQKFLADYLGRDVIHLGCELTNIARSENGIVLEFKNGDKYFSDFIIGADGLKSKVRNIVFPNSKLRDAQQICWRGVANMDLASSLSTTGYETWGSGERFGFVQIAKKKVYWFAVKTMNEGDQLGASNLDTYFQDFHPIVKQLLTATPKGFIHETGLLDLDPIKQWHKENICLLGDAAHATTPNMGQGACQAIEDADVLAECLDQYEYEKAFQEYQRLRMPKAHLVVKNSWFIGKIAHWRGAFATSFRNNLMRMTPTNVNRKQLAKVFELAVV